MPGGRPPALDKIVHVRPNGQQVTAAEQVLERIRLGLDYTESADTSAISRVTLHHWRVAGAQARAKAAAGGKLTKTDRQYAEFLNALERAHAEAHLERLAVIQRATQPFTVTKVVTRTAVQPDGTERVVERTTTTEQKAGQWTAAAWWLERRMPERYARRVEVSGPEGGPIPVEQRAAAVADSLRTFMQGAAEGAAAATEQADR